MTMRLLLPVLALLLAACGGRDQYPIDREAPPELPQGEYVAVDLPAPYGPRDTLRLTFEGDRLSFQATCNTMSGTASLGDDRVLLVDSVGGTEMGCPGQGFEQDDWLVDFFTSSPTLDPQASDAYRLTVGDTTLALLRPGDLAPRPDDASLEGTRWRLTGVEERDGDAVGMTSVPRRTDAWLRIESGEVRFETGCNSGGGEVAIDGDRLRFRRVVVTTAGCLGPGAELEGPQVEVLMHRQAAWAIDGDQLRISRGGTALLYTAR
jgi:heat shock protein HslJ